MKAGLTACVTRTPSLRMLPSSARGVGVVQRGRTLSAALCLLKLEDTLPIVFHADQCPVALLRCIQCLVEVPKIRLPIVGVFAGGVCMMHDQPKAASARHRRPLQHL